MEKTHKEILEEIRERAEGSLRGAGSGAQYDEEAVYEGARARDHEGALEGIKDLLKEQDDEHVCITLTQEEKREILAYTRMGFYAAADADLDLTKEFRDQFQKILDKIESA